MCVNKGEEEAWIVQNSKSSTSNLEVFELATYVGDHISHPHFFLYIYQHGCIILPVVKNIEA